MVMTGSIESFSGTYGFLSNFYSSPVRMDGAEYPTVEHAYQAGKTLDHNLRAAIANAGGPSAARRLGRTLQIRPDWEEVKVDLMRELLAEKFRPSTYLSRDLIRTGDATLIEGNYWHDLFWGVCMCKEHKGAGKNWLGELLMRQREALTGR